LSHPDARHPLEATRLNPVGCSGTDKYLFEVTHIPMRVATVWTKVENRVTNQLPGTVVGNVPTPGYVEHLDPLTSKLDFGGQNVVPMTPPSDANGDHRRMLKEKQLIRTFAGLACSHQRLLDL
jgi:hypothetical protein